MEAGPISGKVLGINVSRSTPKGVGEDLVRAIRIRGAKVSRVNGTTPPSIQRKQVGHRL